MSSQLSDTSTLFERPLSDSQLSSQLSDFLTGSQPDPLKPDNLQNALSSGWASYLNAQHTGREVATLKRHLDEQVRQLSSSLTLMKRDFLDHQRLVTTTVAEAKEISEQLRSELRQLGPLRDALPPLRQEVRSNQEQVTNAIADMAERVGMLQGKMEGTDIVVSADINSIRQQYSTALEAIRSLQEEIRGLRAEKIAVEQKVAAIESQVGTIDARQELPEGGIELLNRLLLRQDELVHALEGLGNEINPAQDPSGNNANHPSGNNANHPSGEDDDALPCTVVNTQPPPETGNRTLSAKTPSPQTRRRRASNESRKSETKRAPPPPGSDLKTLLLHYREEYERKRPMSEVTFIWTFIDAIDDRALSTHVQTSLAAVSPRWVSVMPNLRRRPSGRYISIRKGLRWKDFQKALLKMPPMSASKKAEEVTRE
ncbi:hypothetical protein QBC34DRAFT_376968 [Podospora aff. communis PSN243]|uniref:Uncharacterized protein n=1 Tax=Podospora aff. communis PSN243 TaxID=3040156 RepID=A0AAV9GX32_9PEZI|nr:hypothetical protein QBC34DRAFT_376968 [Podospora aff. communis PSN243]